jgi:hypothetical protein
MSNGLYVIGQSGKRHWLRWVSYELRTEDRSGLSKAEFFRRGEAHTERVLAMVPAGMPEVYISRVRDRFLLELLEEVILPVLLLASNDSVEPTRHIISIFKREGEVGLKEWRIANTLACQASHIYSSHRGNEVTWQMAIAGCNASAVKCEGFEEPIYTFCVAHVVKHIAESYRATETTDKAGTAKLIQACIQMKARLKRLFAEENARWQAERAMA